MIDFVSLGEQTIAQIPTLRCVPLAAPTTPALYRRRLAAALSSTAEYLSFVDGGEDVLSDGFVAACEALVVQMREQDAPIGYCAETVHGQPGAALPFKLSAFLKNHTMVHHGVVCEVAALRAIDWPRGCYHWEGIAYGTLAQRGFVFDPEVRYDWRPGKTGAHTWPDTARGIINAKRWLRGLPVPALHGDI